MCEQKTRRLDGEIVTVDLNRRSFLARAVGTGTIAFSAILAQACESGGGGGGGGNVRRSDRCDFDTGSDSDVTRTADPAGGGTDSDTGRNADPAGGGTDSDVTVYGDPARSGDYCDTD